MNSSMYQILLRVRPPEGIMKIVGGSFSLLATLRKNICSDLVWPRFSARIRVRGQCSVKIRAKPGPGSGLRLRLGLGLGSKVRGMGGS
jgi:hypothetical protein